VNQISTWHICISGFRQHEQEPTGMQRLWVKLGDLRSPSTIVMLREWNSDWRSLAELIAQMFDYGFGSAPPDIYVYAYSWGAGYGLPTLARYLLPSGLEIKHAVLADPVYRSRLVSFRWLAMTKWGDVEIPENVRRVWWTRQTIDWPRGHELVAVNPRKTRIDKPLVVNRGHLFMDEDPIFHNLALSARVA